MTDSALRRPLLWLLLAYIAGLCWWRARDGLAPAVTTGDLARDRRAAVVGAVADGPSREDLLGWKVEASALSADGAPFRYRLLLRWPRYADGDRLPWPGQAALLQGRLRRPRPARDPGDFDEAAFLAERGIAWVLDVRSFAVSGAPPASSPSYWAERLHRSTRARLRALLPPDRARLLEGLLLGYKGALRPKLARAVRDAGLVHLIVPSGAKIALALALAAFLAAGLRLGPWPTAALAGGLGAVLVLAAGGEPPYWRAYAAAMVLLCGRACGRDVDALQALLLAAWLELLAAPRALFSAGFQMTYVAVAALLAFGPALWKAARGVSPAPLRAAAMALAASAVVQAALWPIFAGTFGRGSLAGAGVNAAVMPLAPLLAAAGWLLWAVSFACAPAARAVAAALSAVLAGFERLCFAAAALPGAGIPLAVWPWTSTAAYYLALIGLSRASRGRAAAWLSAALVLRAGAAWAARGERGDLRVVYLRVPARAGRPRRAALVTFDGLRTWLIGDAPPSLVARACRAYGLEDVDGQIPETPGLRLCRGAECLAFDPPGPVSAQSAIIALPSEIHVRFPR